MKNTYLIATIGGLLLSGLAIAQEGNSAYRDLLENKHTQEILKKLKDDPEAAARAAQSNPNDLIRNATAAFADSQKKQNPNETPAVRGGRSTTDKALGNINRMLAAPVNSNPQALPVPGAGELRDLKVNSSQIKKLKSVARETIPQLSNIIPDDPRSTPQISGVPAVPQISSVPQPAPRQEVAANRRTSSPLNYSPQQAPPAPIRNMQPTVPNIPDTPELFSGAAPAPQALGRRYPKPEKFRSPLPQKGSSQSAPKPEKDTMVITSNESVMDRKNQELTFKGDVEVEMDGLNLTCDHMVVFLDKDNKMKKIVATGGTVQIMKTGENGQPQLAKARKAEYIAATKTATLSGGPPYLQNGDQYINTDTEDSIIELGGDGRYRVYAPKSKGRNVIVVPISNAKDLNKGLDIEKKMNGFGR